MKYKKIFAIFFAISLLTLSVRAKAYEVLNCQYWYSDSNSVGRWAFSPTITSVKLNDNEAFGFVSAYLYAKDAWNNAGISLAHTSSTSANIVCYGGTASEIYERTGFSLSDTTTGLTSYSSTMYKYLNYNGTQYNLRNMSRATVMIKDRGATLNQYKKTTMHEMGHALGWMGHSSYSTDVMYASSSSVTTLSFRDIWQILQF